MDLERALETQRLALLRILAGLMVLVVFMSVMPAVSMVPRRAGSFVSAQLMRIESAVEIMVHVAARVFCGYHSRAWPQQTSFARNEARSGTSFSTGILLRRIARLRLILKDLPRFARRLAKRLTRTRAAVPMRTWPLKTDRAPARTTPLPVRIERPPDKRPGLFRFVRSFTPS